MFIGYRKNPLRAKWYPTTIHHFKLVRRKDPTQNYGSPSSIYIVFHHVLDSKEFTRLYVPYRVYLMKSVTYCTKELCHFIMFFTVSLPLSEYNIIGQRKSLDEYRRITRSFMSILALRNVIWPKRVSIKTEEYLANRKCFRRHKINLSISVPNYAVAEYQKIHAILWRILQMCHRAKTSWSYNY